MLNLVINNGQVTQPHKSAVPALHAITDLIIGQIRSGKKSEAIDVVKQQKFPPMALSFVASCLVHNGIPNKTIEAILLPDLKRQPQRRSANSTR